MSNRSGKLLGGILDPMERISEILFGVIMALTFTCALGVATANSINVSTMLLGVFGCNLAWGIIDGGVYLVERIYDQGRNIRMLRAMHEAVDIGAARRIIFEALPPLLASTLSEEQLESMRRKLHQMPNLPERPQLTRRDAFAALGVCLLCFLSTLPIALAIYDYQRCQAGFAHIQCDRRGNAHFLWLCVRASQRASALDNCSLNGCLRQCNGGCRDGARRVTMARAQNGEGSAWAKA